MEMMMNETVEATTGDAIAPPPPTRIGRSFKNVSPAAVFSAWTSADQVKRWFAPGPFEAPEANVEARVGGPFEVCMAAPNGERHWMRGAFTEVVENERLAFESTIPGPDGKALFTAQTLVTFAPERGGARLEVVQTYVIYDPAAIPMVGGAAMGWSMTLDNLEREVARLGQSA
jgi:uncharacterized protein YndB with AHSA1/START domain